MKQLFLALLSMFACELDALMDALTRGRRSDNPFQARHG
jgi:hypothetical protein